MMKKTKLIGLIAALMITGISQLFAQAGSEYKIDMNSGKLLFKEIHNIEFVGHTGSGVLIKATNEEREESERAKGLKLINGLGLDDNTGIGLSVVDEGGLKTVHQISRNSDTEFIVQVPKGVTIVYEHSSAHGDDVSFKNITGEIEATTNHSDLMFNNVTGPMTVNTVHGDIDINFSSVNQSNPMSIVSSHGDIDMSVPAATKATLKISSDWGEIYSDLDIKVESKESSMKRYNSNDVSGTLNGGGVNIKVKSSHGSIYLRKK